MEQSWLRQATRVVRLQDLPCDAGLRIQEQCLLHCLAAEDALMLASMVRKLSCGCATRFRHMMWSSHPRLEGEMPGKASNVDWAARSACSHFRELGAWAPLAACPCL